jgi:aspartate beta-hydroxylase
VTEEEIDALLEREPANLAGLLAKGDCRLEAGDERSATTFYTAALRAAERQGAVSPAVAEDLRRARTRVAKAGGSYRAHLEQWLAEAGLAPAEVGDRFRRSIEILFGERQAVMTLQRPGVFYFDGLPQRAYYERAEFGWLDGLEAATGAIREELLGVLEDGQGVTPYVRPQPNRPHHDFHGLLGDPRWSAFYLIEDGEPHPVNAARCPRTLDALADAPLCRMPGWTPSVHFSLLRPGARIPPHTGMLNTRLICHLPLIVPPGCALRVGAETRAWEEGKTLIFDDSIEHEAWNDSDRLRVILLFDIWRPELTEAERAAVSAMFAAIDAYRSA